MLHSTALKRFSKLRQQGLLSFYLHDAVLEVGCTDGDKCRDVDLKRNAHDLFGIRLYKCVSCSKSHTNLSPNCPMNQRRCTFYLTAGIWPGVPLTKPHVQL